MRTLILTLAVLTSISTLAQQSSQSPKEVSERYTLTVVIEGVNEKDGNMGVLVYTSQKGWPEEIRYALRDIIVPPQPGVMTVEIPDLPAGTYAVAVCHDVNKNRKLDKNFLGMPREQWGLSNNPHATIKAPPFSKSQFALKSNMTIHVIMR